MNNPMVRVMVVLAVLLGAGWWGARTMRTRAAEYEHKLDLERIRREYLERAPLARAIADPARYADEERALGKWYVGELSAHYAKWPAYKDYERRFMDELLDRKKAKSIKDEEFAQYEERYKATLAWWELFRSGRYAPVFTGADKGLRFDVYRVVGVPDAREPRLRLMFTLQGAQRRWSVDTSTGARVSRMNVSASFGELLLKGLDGGGKTIRELRVSGDPFKIDYPERFLEEFPPGVVIGYYEIPKIPADVENAELTFNISTRSVVSGDDVPATFTWSVPVESEWKLPPGVSWEGEQEEVREKQ